MRLISKAGAEHIGAHAAERGYAFVAALIVLVGLALTAQITMIPTKSALVRNDEAELLFRGQAYIAAIDSYRSAIKDDPGLPESLEMLVDDRRSGRRRHIRRLYDDPMAGGGWMVLRGEDGGVRGLASTAPGTPRRTAFFPEGLSHFASASSYADWKFEVKGTAP